MTSLETQAKVTALKEMRAEFQSAHAHLAVLKAQLREMADGIANLPGDSELTEQAATEAADAVNDVSAADMRLWDANVKMINAIVALGKTENS